MTDKRSILANFCASNSTKTPARGKFKKTTPSNKPPPRGYWLENLRVIRNNREYFQLNLCYEWRDINGKCHRKRHYVNRCLEEKIKQLHRERQPLEKLLFILGAKND